MQSDIYHKYNFKSSVVHGIVHYHWWTSSLKPRLLAPMHAMLSGHILFLRLILDEELYICKRNNKCKMTAAWLISQSWRLSGFLLTLERFNHFTRKRVCGNGYCTWMYHPSATLLIYTLTCKRHFNYLLHELNKTQYLFLEFIILFILHFPISCTNKLEQNSMLRAWIITKDNRYQHGSIVPRSQGSSKVVSSKHR